MDTIKAVAAVALWRTGKFDSAEIARALSVPEAVVARVLHIAREAGRRVS